MNKYEIIKKIEDFAPLETQEEWDCCGWAIKTTNENIHKVMLCLTVTTDVMKQAKDNNCDMIISHHPMFCINCYCPVLDSEFCPTIDIYCAHTNLDKAHGGTTDTLINELSQQGLEYKNIEIIDFLRIITLNTPIQISELSKFLKKISPNARLVNNQNHTQLNKIAFCAGSGSEFIQQAKDMGADCLITGDLKFHTSLDSEIVLYDIGHFESEILILPKLKELLGNDVETMYAQERSPFIYI